MKPIEVLEEIYSDFLKAKEEAKSWEQFVRYNGAKRLALLSNLITSEQIASMETKTLIEWESSLETAGKEN